MPKTEVYSWRVSTEMKTALEEAARREKHQISRLLERIVQEWLKESHSGRRKDSTEQRRLHQAAARAIGRIGGGNPRRSETARQALRARIAKGRAG